MDFVYVVHYNVLLQVLPDFIKVLVLISHLLPVRLPDEERLQGLLSFHVGLVNELRLYVKDHLQHPHYCAW